MHRDVISPIYHCFGEVDTFLVKELCPEHAREQVFHTDPCHMPDGSVLLGHSLWTPIGDRINNAFLYEWGNIVQNLLRGSPDGKAYHIGGVYFEFDNSGADVDPVPTISRSDSLSYYNSLNSGDPNRDYLRVPLLATEQATSDVATYPKNNIARFIAQTAGTVGVHGNTYSDGANSRVYGGALVSFLDESDDSQDVILSRFYYAPGSQIVKPAGSQIGITWSTTFI